MERLSTSEFARLTIEEKYNYLVKQLGEESDSAENNYVLDSDDEEWFLVPDEQTIRSEMSDHEETKEDQENPFEVESELEAESENEVEETNAENEEPAHRRFCCQRQHCLDSDMYNSTATCSSEYYSAKKRSSQATQKHCQSPTRSK